MFSANSTVNQ